LFWLDKNKRMSGTVDFSLDEGVFILLLSKANLDPKNTTLGVRITPLVLLLLLLLLLLSLVLLFPREVIETVFFFNKLIGVPVVLGVEGPVSMF
jgi:hypothetical protein